MENETLEDHLRRATRNFTARLPEDQVLTLGRDLARELARAHAETPPRFPELEPSVLAMEGGSPRLSGTRPGGEASEDLFRLGALLMWLSTGERPQVSWRLDGPPPASLSSLARRAVLELLAAPRRAHRIATAAEAAQALDAALQASPQGPPPWALFRGDLERTGRAAGAPAAVTGLTASWQARVGSVLSSPAVTADLVLAITADGRLLFLDRGLGRRVHEVKVGSTAESSPAVADGLVHVGNDDGELVGIDLARGEERYRLKLGQLVRSSPLPLPEGPVVVGVVEAKNAGGLVALDPRKGKPLWVCKLAAVFSSPARAGAKLVVGCDDGSVHAVAADKGTVAWSHKVGGKVRATPLVSGGLAVVGSFDGRVVALRVADGTPAWASEIGHSLYSSPCLAGDLVVVGCHDGHLHALDLQTGQARFETTTRGPVVASAAALGASLLTASTDGALYVVDGSGRVVHRVVLAESIQSSPAVAGDQAFVGSSGGVHAVRLSA